MARHAARAFQQPRMFGLLVEYSPLAAGAAVQRAFDAGYICVYVVSELHMSVDLLCVILWRKVCPGMTRDTCSSDLIETAGRNNCNLRSSGRAIRGEICIYQVRCMLYCRAKVLSDRTIAEYTG